MLVVGLTHRGVLLWRMRPALLALVAQGPGFQVMQLLPVEIYRKHFWTGLWLLQQTPPVAHLVFRLVLLAGGWPFRTAELLCGLQGVISSVTAWLLCRLIRKLTRSRLAAVSASLWFLLSTDLVVSEYAFFGQMFYESLGMLGVLACCWQGHRIAEVRDEQASGRAGMLGMLVAVSALTRSSLNFLPLAFGVAGALTWRRRMLAAYLVPLLLLQGGWTVKNWIALGRLTVDTSSWSGMNVAKGVFWAHQDLLLLHDIADAPPGLYPPWFQAIGRNYTYPFQVSTRQLLPPQLRARDDAMTARLGGITAPWNLPSVAAESDAWRIAVARFTVAHPVLLLTRFGRGYRFLWQRIADHAALFAWNLLYVEPADRCFPGLAHRGFGETERVATRAWGVGAQPGRKTWFGTISLAPFDALSIVVLHSLFPSLVLLDHWRHRRGLRRYLARGTSFLAMASLYGLVLFSLAEGGENMRFRLAIEPVLIALTMCTLAASWVGLKDGWSILGGKRLARTCA